MAVKSPSHIQPAIKRLLHELRLQSQNSAPHVISLGPVSDEQLLSWEAIMRGVPNTAYEAGCWKLSIKFPESYPLTPPNVNFDTTICHPNIQFKTGEICLDLLKSSWSPAYTISHTLDAIHQLLAYPAPDSPLNVDIASLLRNGDKVGAEALVRFYCEEKRWSLR
ncbi:MAG: hypothetical protein HETSPECPRED_000259 [Heterodermia speciosa]|uniref:UBC core domain-containing protein n=1 Tax=Heterodermia speciosa TaxID=116794 RepID=A0A8H3I7L3_9LECA|nr:MAG: hypothetical protein HETSPECPRED_000259 [Heterodermia speciosa]